MVLGLKNATQNLGLNMIRGGALTAYVGDYGANIGTHSGSVSNDVGTYGITTDGTKSGIIADTSNFQNMLYCIKY